MTDPIEDLQSRLAHQELAIEALNEAVARQDRLLLDLQAEIRSLHERLQALKPSPLGEDPMAEPPPPHY
ncbi:MAG: SlyX family protein [Chromatiaceae bacterium]|jgi:SlyX protein